MRLFLDLKSANSYSLVSSVKFQNSFLRTFGNVELETCSFTKRSAAIFTFVSNTFYMHFNMFSYVGFTLGSITTFIAYKETISCCNKQGIYFSFNFLRNLISIFLRNNIWLR